MYNYNYLLLTFWEVLSNMNHMMMVKSTRLLTEVEVDRKRNKTWELWFPQIESVQEENKTNWILIEWREIYIYIYKIKIRNKVTMTKRCKPCSRYNGTKEWGMEGLISPERGREDVVYFGNTYIYIYLKGQLRLNFHFFVGNLKKRNCLPVTPLG